MHFFVKEAHNNPIPVKKETKFLGILLNSKLTFFPFKEGPKKKCVKALNLLRIVSNTGVGIIQGWGSMMTGNGHIELFKVTSYNFHPQEHA